MHCKKCGSEMSEDNSFCEKCETEIKKNIIMRGDKNMKKILKMLLSLILCFGLMACSSGAKEENKVVSGLKEIAQISDGGEEITFLYESENNVGTFKKWTLNYSDENEFIRFWDDSIDEIFFLAFGENCKTDTKDDSFIYDLSEDEIRIYFNPQYTGGIEIINYNIRNDEFVLNKDGEKYYASDDFLQFIEDNNLITIIQTNMKIFETKLKNNGLSIEDITKLRYKDIKECL